MVGKLTGTGLMILMSVVYLTVVIYHPKAAPMVKLPRHVHPHSVTDMLTGVMATPLEGGPPVDLGKYRDNVVIIINIASHCGFTELNYRELQKLYAQYQAEGFVVLAFPCNQFGNQEADSPAVIEKFARETKHATFPMFDKIEVNGPNAHPLYKKLMTALNVSKIEWNFGKFILARGGVPLRYYDHRFPFEVIRRQVAELVELRVTSDGAEVEGSTEAA